jgi:hypothetical protein
MLGRASISSREATPSKGEDRMAVTLWINIAAQGDSKYQWSAANLLLVDSYSTASRGHLATNPSSIDRAASHCRDSLVCA